MGIHGNKSQNARGLALRSLKEGTIRVLVATDIAARGIDVSGLPCVINYELPNVPETYVHRIGRTGRAGKPGLAISFCNPDERAWLRDIEKLIRKTIPVEKHHPWSAEKPQSTEQSVKNGLCEATPKAVTRSRRQTGQQTGQKLRLDPMPLPTPSAPFEPPQAPRRVLRSDPWIPGRVVASADGRRNRKKQNQRPAGK